MEVDTGSPVCVISRQIFEKHRKVWPCLKPSRVKLSCYTGRIPVLGELQLGVCYKGVDVDCSLTVLDCAGPSLYGRDLLAKLKDAGMSILQWAGHASAAPNPNCSSSVNIFSDYQDVFSTDLGVSKGPPASLQLKDGVSKFCKARPIPYALRDKLSLKLDRLVSLGVLSLVKHSEWATPIVPVLKKDSNVRISGDFKVALNPACAVEQYPLPVIEDIVSAPWTYDTRIIRCHWLKPRGSFVLLTLAGACFVIIGFRLALPLPRQFFKEKWTGHLRACQVCKPLDDVLVSEKKKDDNGERLKSVLERFREHGVKLRYDKCTFCQPAVTYLGHRIDKQGLHPIEKKTWTQSHRHPAHVT